METEIDAVFSIFFFWTNNNYRFRHKCIQYEQILCILTKKTNEIINVRFKCKPNMIPDAILCISWTVFLHFSSSYLFYEPKKREWIFSSVVS